MPERIAITGAQLICASGKSPAQALRSLLKGQTGISEITQFDTSAAGKLVGGEIADFTERELVPDRKLHKLLRRYDFLGLYAGSGAVDSSGASKFRDTLDSEQAEIFCDRTAIFTGSGGTAYRNSYAFLAVLASAGNDLQTFGRELESSVNPMWLLQTLPNNVLCHLGIRHGFKGVNSCITNHSASGALALIECAGAILADDADRALAVAYESPIEPQTLSYYRQVGLLSDSVPRPFDRARNGAVLGEGAGALMLERESAARSRDADVIGWYLGGACTSEAGGVLPISPDGEGLERAIRDALVAAELQPDDIGMVVAHGNGTVQSDVSEARALARVFNKAAPIITAFKWGIGHTLSASALLEAVLALEALASGEAPGIATLTDPIDEARPLRIITRSAALEKKIVLVLSRGFGGMSTATAIAAADYAAS